MATEALYESHKRKYDEDISLPRSWRPTGFSDGPRPTSAPYSNPLEDFELAKQKIQDLADAAKRSKFDNGGFTPNISVSGGENSSGARLQVIPLHLPPGYPSMERTVQIDGTSEQIEIAKQMVHACADIMAAEASNSTSSANSHIGGLISVTSKREIKYEGILHHFRVQLTKLDGLDGSAEQALIKVGQCRIFYCRNIKDMQVISSPSVQPVASIEIAKPSKGADIMAAEASKPTSSADSYIDTSIRVRFTSRGIGFEGELYIIGLENVKSFRTDGNGEKVPLRGRAYRYKKFSCEDMKDLQVISSPPVQVSLASLSDVEAVLTVGHLPALPLPHASRALHKRVSSSCYVGRFRELVLNLNNKQKRWVKKMEIEHLLDLGIESIDPMFEAWITSKFNPITSMLALRDDYHVRVNEEMVGWALGFMYGLFNPIIAYQEDYKKWKEFYQCKSSDVILEKDVFDIVLNEKSDAKLFKQHFLLYALGVLLCPTHSEKIYSQHVFFLVDARRARLCNWAKYVLDWLVLSRQSGEFGCTLLLLLIYIDRIEYSRTVKWSLKKGRISFWKQADVHCALESDKVEGKYGNAKVVRNVVYGKPYPQDMETT